ncbi:hypothetical protein Bbelb_098440 [Branchiostoma belcheri]|nr:hypothetical protein Bbelb_098440 [Branchiostoma belcheri]
MWRLNRGSANPNSSQEGSARICRDSDEPSEPWSRQDSVQALPVRVCENPTSPWCALRLTFRLRNPGFPSPLGCPEYRLPQTELFINSASSIMQYRPQEPGGSGN